MAETQRTIGPVVGIDLGTTNSLVAFMQGDTPAVIPGEDGSPIVPSVVAFDQDTQSRILRRQRRAQRAADQFRATPSTPSSA